MRPWVKKNVFGLFLVRCPILPYIYIYILICRRASKCIYKFSNWYLKTCAKIRKTFYWQGNLAERPFPSVFGHRRDKNMLNHYGNMQGLRHSLHKWRLGIIFEAINAEKMALVYFLCKLGQILPIAMKLELDMSHGLLHVYTRLQIVMSKHVEESPENFE